MSEFMVIAPSDYALMDINAVINATQFSIGELKRLEESQSYGDFTEMLKAHMLIPEGKEGIVATKLVEDRDFYIKFY